MADLEPILQNIFLNLEASLKGQDKLLSVLEKISASTTKTQESLSAYKKSSETASKSVSGLSNSLEAYNKSAASATRASENIFNGFKKIGQAARTSLGAITGVAATTVGALAIALKQTGQSLLNFQISSANASTAVANLTKAYRGLGDSAATSFVSLQQLADVMTQFQSKGFAERLVGSSQEFTKGIEGILDSMTRVFGRDRAAEMVSGFTDSLKDQFGTMVRTVEQQINPLSKSMAAGLDAFETGKTLELKIAGKEEYIQSAQQIIEVLNKLRKNSNDPGKITEIIGGIKTGMDTITGSAPASVAAVVSLNDAYSRLRAIIDQVQLKATETFGPLVVKTVQTLNTWVHDHLEESLRTLYGWFEKIAQWFIDHKTDIVSVFKFMGDSIKYAVQSIRELVGSYNELSPLSQTLIKSAMGIGVAFAFIPGLATGVSLVTKGFWALGKKALETAVGADVLASSMKSVILSGGKMLGVIGAGAAGAYAGLTLAEKAAIGLGAEADGTVTSISKIVGAAGGAAAAVALIAPPLAPIAGVVAGITVAVGELASKWSETRVEVEKARDAIENSEGKTNKLKAQAAETKKRAILPIDQLRAEQDELEVILSELEDKKLKAQLDGVYLGFHIYTPNTSNIDKEIDDVRNRLRDKMKVIVDVDAQKVVPQIELPETVMKELDQLDKRTNDIQVELKNLGQASVQVDTKDVVKLIDELEVVKQRKQQIQELGPMMIDLGKTNQEIQALTQELGSVDAGKLDEVKDRLKDLERQKSLTQQEINVVITGVDRKAIETELKAISEQFSKFQDQHKQIKLGVGLDQSELPKEISDVKKKFSELKEHIEKVDKSGQFDNAITNIEKLQRAIDSASDSAEHINKAFEDFHLTLKGVSSERLPRLDAFTISAEALSDALSTLGPEASLAGRKLSDSIGNLTKQAFDEASATVRDLEASLIDAYKLIDADPKNILGVVQGYENLQRVMAVLNKYAKLLISADETSLENATLEKDILEAQLKISKNLYGAPLVAVSAQVEIFKAMQSQKEIMESQLATTQQLRKVRESMGEDVRYLKKQELELQLKIRNLQAEQLANVRELRDGYLDAVQAQAFAGGAFEKILITREKNTMRGLQKGIVKYNYLLGQIGDAASRAKAMPARFGAQGMGMMEDMSGKPMTKEETQKQNELRIENIADPSARDAAMQAQQIVMGAQNNTEFLADTVASGTNRTVDAINRLAEGRILATGGALALKGTPAGETATGSLVNRELTNQMNKFDKRNQESEQRLNQTAKYLQQAQNQGASKDALTTIAKSASAFSSPVAQETQIVESRKEVTDSDLFIKFLKQSLVYYKKSLFALKRIANITDITGEIFENLTLAPGESAINVTNESGNSDGYYNNVSTTISNTNTSTATTSIINQDRVTPPPTVDNYVNLPEIPKMPDNYVELPKIEIPKVEMPAINLPDNYVELPKIEIPPMPKEYITVQPPTPVNIADQTASIPVSIEQGPVSNTVVNEQERVFGSTNKNKEVFTPVNNEQRKYDKTEGIDRYINEFKNTQRDLNDIAIRLGDAKLKYSDADKATNPPFQRLKELESQLQKAMQQKGISEQELKNAKKYRENAEKPSFIMAPITKEHAEADENELTRTANNLQKWTETNSKNTLEVQKLSEQINSMKSYAIGENRDELDKARKDAFDMVEKLSNEQYRKQLLLSEQKRDIHTNVLSQEGYADYGLAPRIDFSQMPKDIFTNEGVSPNSSFDQERLEKVNSLKNRYEQNKKLGQIVQRGFSVVKSYIGNQIANIPSFSTSIDESKSPSPSAIEIPSLERTDVQDIQQKTEPIKEFKFIHGKLDELASSVSDTSNKLPQISHAPIRMDILENVTRQGNNILLQLQNTNRSQLDVARKDQTQNKISSHHLSSIADKEFSAATNQQNPFAPDVFLEAVDYRQLMQSESKDDEATKRFLNETYGSRYSEKILKELEKMSTINNKIAVNQNALDNTPTEDYQELRRFGDTEDAHGFSHSTPESKQASRAFVTNRQKLAKEQERLIKQQEKQQERLRKTMEFAEKNKKKLSKPLSSDGTLSVDNTKFIEAEEKQEEAQIKMGLRYKEEDEAIPAKDIPQEAFSPVQFISRETPLPQFEKLDETNASPSGQLNNYSRTPEFDSPAFDAMSFNTPSFDIPVAQDIQPMQNYEIMSATSQGGQASIPDVYEGERGVFAPNMMRTLTKNRTAGNYSSQMKLVAKVLMEMAAAIDRLAENSNKPIQYRRPGRFSNNIPG